MLTLYLGLFGLLVGAYGSLVGVGGGFLVVPALLLFLKTSPQQAIGSSLMVVLCSATSATLSYIRTRRIDYRSGWRFALATLPGAFLGAFITRYFSTEVFAPLFGGLLAALALLLLARSSGSPGSIRETVGSGSAQRRVTDASGREFVYAFSEWKGLGISALAGFFSSILGIGGGIIHMPALVQALHFPPHVAAATSTFILLFSALIGAGTHLALGHVLVGPVVPITVGAIVGAQVGAGLSGRVSEAWLMRFLALALVAVAIRLILR
ncbi:MAG TPA: sulfite exporter TauE/SafE family protein [Armatimonadetes bacterium]|nr:sulfite exporter TauE/SafE family protein [Armatimonadota bacterium]